MTPNFIQLEHRQLRLRLSLYLGSSHALGACCSQVYISVVPMRLVHIAVSHAATALLLRKWKHTSTKLPSETLLTCPTCDIIVGVTGCSGGLLLEGVRVFCFRGPRCGAGPTCHRCYILKIWRTKQLQRSDLRQLHFLKAHLDLTQQSKR